jgi:hypothetical protein
VQLCFLFVRAFLTLYPLPLTDVDVFKAYPVSNRPKTRSHTLQDPDAILYPIQNIIQPLHNSVTFLMRRRA